MFLHRLFRFPKLSPGAALRSRPARLSLESLDDRLVPASLSVGDVAVVEGNAGAQSALVSVTLDAPSRRTVTVNYSTADGTARAGPDYGAASGRLTFAPGETSKMIAVPVYGDGQSEADESFVIKLSGARRAEIRDGQGIVTIINDDPAVTPGHVGVSVGDAEGTVVHNVDGVVIGTTLHFTVSLAAASDQEVTINYATADGTATAGVDYVAASGTLTFAPGETTKTIAVQAIGNDAGIDEWFSVNLSAATGNAQINDGQGIGTIHYYFEQPYYDPGCNADSPYWPNCSEGMAIDPYSGLPYISTPTDEWWT